MAIRPDNEVRELSPEECSQRVGEAPRTVLRAEPHTFVIAFRFFYAPEWTRTTTPFTQDKALNLIGPCHIRPPASRSSDTSGFADTSDASDELTFVKHLSRGKATMPPPELANLGPRVVQHLTPAGLAPSPRPTT
jgi:hypothetical protein